jgi:adenylate kinase family enzyme
LEAGVVEPSKAEWAETVRQVIGREAWVLDGNYSGTLAERLKACDAVVFLDVPRLTCLWCVLRRVARHYGKSRPDMPAGCPEKLDIGFLSWIWNYPTRTRTRVLALLDTYRDAKNVIHLRTRKDVERFVSAAGHR